MTNTTASQDTLNSNEVSILSRFTQHPVTYYPAHATPTAPNGFVSDNGHLEFQPLWGDRLTVIEGKTFIVIAQAVRAPAQDTTPTP